MGRRRKIVVENLKVIGFGDKGKGVAKDEQGNVYFMPDVVPGDEVDVLVLRKKKSYREGVVIKFRTLAEIRIAPTCEHFGSCGGCKHQHIPYEWQLKFKQKRVTEQLERIGKVDTPVMDILPCDEPFEYRNKTEFSFSPRKWLPKELLKTDVSNTEDVLGFHAPGTFDKIVDIQRCHLQAEDTNQMRLVAKQLAIEHELPFYDMKAHEGFIRSMMIRNTTLGDKMVVFSFAREDPKIALFLEAVNNALKIDALYYCINSKLNDFIFDLEMHLFAGKPYIEEKLGDLVFRIGPKSFFQTNTRQAEKLYQKVAEFAALSGTENVYDLYTGLGSIALFLAKHCRQVVGIEEIERAIEDAHTNMKLNDIDNAIFYAGDVKNILTKEFAAKHGAPDVLITDPPRAGMHEQVVEMLLQLEAPKIVYVSCNPATQARDLKLLGEKYDVKKLQPVDMFPQTYHIENIALLELKGNGRT